MFAIIKTGGKQYKVSEGDTIRVEKVETPVGQDHTFDSVIMIENGGDITFGKPFVTGAKVVAEVLQHARGKKLVVFFYRHKTTHKRRKGHRQSFTQLRIKQIQGA